MTARELARRTAAVLEDVELERQVLLVSRAGRPVAILAPLQSWGAPNASQNLLNVVVLTPLERRIILKAAARMPHPTNFGELGDDVSELLRALRHLEWDALLSQVLAGYLLTEAGAIVAAALKAKVAEGSGDPD